MGQLWAAGGLERAREQGARTLPPGRAPLKPAASCQQDSALQPLTPSLSKIPAWYPAMYGPDHSPPCSDSFPGGPAAAKGAEKLGRTSQRRPGPSAPDDCRTQELHPKAATDLGDGATAPSSLWKQAGEFALWVCTASCTPEHTAGPWHAATMQGTAAPCLPFLRSRESDASQGLRLPASIRLGPPASPIHAPRGPLSLEAASSR